MNSLEGNNDRERAPRLNGNLKKIIMINDLNVSNDVMWKYVDDSNISETVKKDEVCHIQSTVDEFVHKSKAEKFVLNERKCKEMRISFRNQKRTSHQLR